MKKRQRPSFLRQLEERYGARRGLPGDGTRPHASRSEPKVKLPVVYPVAGRPAKRIRPRGEIDMSIQQFVSLAILFVVLAVMGSAAATFTVVEVFGGGPQGEQGPAGIAGAPGPEGPQGPQGLAGPDASQEMIKRLASMFAVQQASALQGGAFVAFNEPQIGQCVEYILTGEPGVGACPGFQ